MELADKRVGGSKERKGLKLGLGVVLALGARGARKRPERGTVGKAWSVHMYVYVFGIWCQARGGIGYSLVRLHWVLVSAPLMAWREVPV